MARNLRQQKILELIAHESIGTQEDLAARLNAEGFAVTQATVSRDIKELGLIKTSADGKKNHYAREKSEGAVVSRFAEMFRNSFVSSDCANNIVVVKMLTGSGNVAGNMIDRMKNPYVLGCVSGDDTTIAVLRDNESALRLTEQLRELARS